jgi:glucose repression regulatory protein TUP1
LIRLWDAADGKYLDKIEGHTDSVYSVCFGPQNTTLISSSLDKTLRYWNITSLPGLKKYFDHPSNDLPLLKQAYNGHKDFVLSVGFSPDYSFVVSGSKDRSLAFWDIESGEPYLMLQGHKNSGLFLTDFSHFCLYQSSNGYFCNWIG